MGDKTKVQNASSYQNRCQAKDVLVSERGLTVWYTRNQEDHRDIDGDLGCDLLQWKE